MKRVREQLEANPGFKAAGVVKVSATGVLLPSAEDGRTLEEMVQTVADRITETAKSALASRPSAEDEKGNVNADIN
jgi:hypothetical protein